MKALNLIIALLCALSASALDGDWRGKLDLGAAKLSTVFHFKSNPRSCTLDSPDQGAKGIPCTITYCQTDTVAVFVPMLGASFSGKIADGRIFGTFKQNGLSLPLILEPESPENERRPQTPKPPYPYEEQDFSFTTPDGATFSATLTLPESPKAAVVLVSGSGPQNRDEEIFEHKPFHVIADRLARAGIASLRYDDRGTAKSTGDFASATTFTFASDAAHAVASLRLLGMDCPVGVIGHSEGGTIAFMLAADKLVDFAVSLAGAVQPGIDIIVEQNRNALVDMGISGTELEQSITFINEYLLEIAAGNKPDAQAIVNEKELSVPDFVIQQAEKGTDKNIGPWFATFLNIKPAEYISRINCPLMAVNGTLDTQVKFSLNLPIIRKLLPNALVKEYIGLNHLFQHASTGAVSEYGEISETFAEEVIADIISFIFTSI